MIVVKLIGGLGNQLFQYAAGLALANYHNTELYLDINHLNEDSKGAYTQRHFELDKFEMVVSIADLSIMQNFDFDANKFLTKIKKVTPGLFDKMIFNEHQFNFHSNFFKLPATTYLNGYWQSEKYFKSVRDKLVKDVSLKIDLSANAKLLADKINSGNSVSVHVRRGDFVSLRSANHLHGSLGIEYYEQAVALVNSKVKEASFFVFSDDPDWCKTNLNFIKNAEFINGKALGISTHEELILMSLCKNNIVANSSFSWWGAWLNQSKHKVVVAPKKWFSDNKINTNDLIPEGWTRI